MVIDKTRAINPMDLIPQEPQEPEQPTLSPEEALEQEILQQSYYRDWETDRKSTRLNSSHSAKSRMPSSA